MHDVTTHQRVNDILLGPLERPALKWLAGHMPVWVTPDIMTVIGVAGAFVIIAGYGLSNVSRGFLWLASLGFVINWFGDSLDGTLARYRQIERPKYGFFVDHILDAFCEVLIFLGLGLTPYVTFDVASICLIAYLLLSILVFVRTYVSGEFKISYSKLGPTELRVIAILLNTFMFFLGKHTIALGKIAGRSLTFSVYDIPIAIIAILLVIFFVTTGIQQAQELAIKGE
jgi:archaetidylinositol phosphate synthase